VPPETRRPADGWNRAASGGALARAPREVGAALPGGKIHGVAIAIRRIHRLAGWLEITPMRADRTASNHKELLGYQFSASRLSIMPTTAMLIIVSDDDTRYSYFFAHLG
jgi:hypothetical protein